MIRKQNIAANECNGCPYGRAIPCIGWCTAYVIAAVKEARESHQADREVTDNASDQS